MKILLINPPRWNELIGKNPGIIEKHRGFNPPLGLLYLASTIKYHTDFKVDVLDAQPLGLTYSALEEYLAGKSYDVVGVSAMTFTLLDAFKTVQLVKKSIPEATTVLGGTHVHLFPEETINLAGVDFVLMGESEFSFIDFLKKYRNRDKLSEVPGLVYKNSDNHIIKNHFSPIKSLDNIPLPDRSLVDINNYSSLLARGSLSTTIVSSRGCPFKCSFCDRPLSPITSCFRSRSSGNVIDEIDKCVKLGINDFLFYDDTFTVNRERVSSICEEILKRKLKIIWDIRARVDTIDREMLMLLKKAGCVAIHYGVEAGNDKTLKAINKDFTVNKVKETFKLTRSIGIDTLAYFMVGLPSQKKNDIQDSVDLVKELNPDYAHFSIFSPYPGTELYYSGLEKGIFKKDIWREFSRNPNENFKVPVWEENFNRDQLYEIITRFYKMFYLRPSYIFSRLMKIRSKNELMRKVKAGFSVFRMRKEDIGKLR